MNWSDLFPKIFELCLLPILGAIGIYVANFFKRKAELLDISIQHEKIQQALTTLSIAIENAVLSTKQTYVDKLKQSGEFGEAEQATALDMTYNKVMESLTEETKQMLGKIIKDLPKYITDCIEAKVHSTKNGHLN